MLCKIWVDLVSYVHLIKHFCHICVVIHKNPEFWFSPEFGMAHVLLYKNQNYFKRKLNVMVPHSLPLAEGANSNCLAAAIAFERNSLSLVVDPRCV